MMRNKRQFLRFIELLAVIGIVCLIHGMAVVGALYYTDNYVSCYEKDGRMPGEGDSKESLEAEFYNFRMMIYSGEEIREALVSMEATEHTNAIGRGLHHIYKAGRALLWIGMVLCVLAFLTLRRRKIYKVLWQGVLGAFVLPFAILFVGLIVRFRAVVNGFACVLFSQYSKVFYDDPAFVSILPRGIFLGYVLVYIAIWLVSSAILLGVFVTKKKHRSPHEF